MDIAALQRIGIVAAICAGQALFIWLLWFLFKKAAARIRSGAGHRIKPFSIGKYRLLGASQVEEVIVFFLNIIKYFLTFVLLFITLPIVFSTHPATEELAQTLFGHILSPLRSILDGFIEHIPNFFTIIIILLITKYVLKALKFFIRQIERGTLVIPGFYTDWAHPTFNILRFLIYAFTLAMIYPHLPGSESRAFQGVSVFVGVIFSLGSSTVIANLVAGLVLTYMRPFKIGDLIELKEIRGYVVEKSPFVIRLRNNKNEIISFPNITVLNSDIINYSTSAGEEGLILHVEITMGYDVPWRTMYDVLISAASKTPHLSEHPKPYVLQSALDDFYARYQLNVYTREVERVTLIYSLLYQHIQDECAAAGINLFAPHFYKSEVPKDAPPRHIKKED